jgi:hypothetical protein
MAGLSFQAAVYEILGPGPLGIEGPPDRRTNADREQAARNQILAMSREFAEASEQ